MSRFTLEYRIALVVTALQTLLIGAVLWLLLSMSAGFIATQMSTKARALVATIGEVSRVALIQGEYDGLQPYLVKLTADPDVVLVRVADARDRIVVSTAEGEVGRPLPTAPPEGRAGQLWLVHPILNPSGKLGTLSVQLSDAVLRHAYQRTRDVALVLALLGVLVSAGIGLLVGHLLTRRLKALSDATEQIASGNFDVSLPVAGGDEVASLSRLFNRMAENLKGHLASLRRSEEQLRQSQKMEAVGRLAGGIAHDFKNLLTIIHCHCEFILPAVEGRVREDVEVILKASESATNLTRQLLALGRRQVLQPRLIDLNALVTSTEQLLRRTLGNDVTLVSRLQPSPWPVRADPVQVEQVIVNLVVNSRDAMPRGGSLTIETSNVVLDEDHARHHAGVLPGEYVMLAVSDTGEGMDAEILVRIFEPFFTTKKDGQGTGLGLSTVYGIVTQSGGHVSAHSEPGHGTTLKVYLPRDQEGTGAELPRTQPLRPVPRGGTILVAEDSVGVRRLARQVLEKNGFLVLEAETGEEALRVAGAHPGPIHLLLTDVVMSGLSGRELAERICAERSGLRVIYMSGYTEDAVIAQGVLRGSIDFLEKPFTTFALERKVLEVLGRGTGATGSGPGVSSRAAPSA